VGLLCAVSMGCLWWKAYGKMRWDAPASQPSGVCNFDARDLHVEWHDGMYWRIPERSSHRTFWLCARAHRIALIVHRSGGEGLESHSRSSCISDMAECNCQVSSSFAKVVV
jgi:hypothetical protein